MCLENGSDMTQLIAEEALFTSAQTSREGMVRRHFIRESSRESNREASAIAEAHTTSHRERIERQMSRLSDRERPQADSTAATSTGASTGSSRPSSQADAQSMVRQLLEMGFAPSWCARAMASTNNDLDAALGWILTHDEDGSSPQSSSGGKDPKGREDEEEEEENAKADSSNQAPSDEHVTLPYNPLSCVSGNCEIRPNLTCTISEGGFPSVGCRGYPAFSGKWYYEVTLYTAGCIQLGWADTAFEGGADFGHGVGDCAHSWAYDGWRTHIWHECAAEWGAKWSKDNVVGCALDMDARTISFYLNGFGQEIGMGVAFEGFQSVGGGLYPCASFNRHEVLQFNFGSTPFKHQPPGYAPYIDNVMRVRENSYRIRRELSDPSYTVSGEGIERRERKGESREEESVIEDSFEEAVGEKGRVNVQGHCSWPWYHRYFSSDEAKATPSPEGMTYFSPSTLSLKPLTDVSPRDAIMKQLWCIARDLCVLYSRLACLRALNHMPICPHDTVKTFLMTLTTSVEVEEVGEMEVEEVGGMGDDQVGQGALTSTSSLSPPTSTSPLEQLFQLITLASAHTNRTKVYLSIMTILPSSYQAPQNLGSIFSSGGYSVLSELRRVVALLTAKSMESCESYSMIAQIITEIRKHTIMATERSCAAHWQQQTEKGLPVVLQDCASDKDSVTVPSLSMAVWCTDILMQCFMKNLVVVCNRDIKEQGSGGEVSPDTNESSTLIKESTTSFKERSTSFVTQLQVWVEKILLAWVFALRSPSIAVKRCALQVLACILQDITSLEISNPLSSMSYLFKVIGNTFSKEGLGRSEEQCVARLTLERGTSPVSSDYLQVNESAAIVCCFSPSEFIYSYFSLLFSVSNHLYSATDLSQILYRICSGAPRILRGRTEYLAASKYA